MAKETSVHVLPKGYKLKSKDRIYEIVEVLGSGSFGITYLAKAKVSVGNISTTMKFAIKEHFISASCYRGEDGVSVLTVPNAKSDVIDSRADFITEANRLKKLCLKSRNIVSVNETFEANGTAYYVMEFLDGGNPKRCTEEEAVSIVMQIASALDEIHQEHVLHLDLKPDNIVLKTNDRNETYPVLIDFGISKHFDSKGRPTSSLSAKGASPGYAPQEQYAGVSEFSPKYDIYALGAVLYYLCIGKNPPDSFKISPNQVELKKELTGTVSPNIEKTILNAMKPSAMERTPSIQRFCDDMLGVDFTPVLEIAEHNLKFNQDKGHESVSIESNIGWNVYSTQDWCKVSKKNGYIIIEVSKNREASIRTCDVVVKGLSDLGSELIKVEQDGCATVRLPGDKTWWELNSKKIYASIGVVVLIGILFGLFTLLKTNPEKESQLSIAINNGDIPTLVRFADKDSLAAYEPLIRALLKQSDLNLAKYYAAKYAEIDTLGYLVPMADIYIKEGNLPVAKSYLVKWVEEFPSDTIAMQKLRDIEAEIAASVQTTWNPNLPEIETTDGEKSSIETNDEKFARASNDFNLMSELAKDNYTKAYYPLAVMYLKKNDIGNAKRWAEKSIKSNINQQEARSLLKSLESREPGSTHSQVQPAANQSDKANELDQEHRLQSALKDPLKGVGTLLMLAEHEHYAPAFYHYARQLLQQGKTSEAKSFLLMSIEKGKNVVQSKELLEAIED